MSTEQTIHFYYRDGCHLCEEMAAALHASWPQHMDRMHWVDVDSSEALRNEYGHRVPVLAVDGRVICQYRLEPEAVSICFGNSRISL